MQNDSCTVPRSGGDMQLSQPACGGLSFLSSEPSPSQIRFLACSAIFQRRIPLGGTGFECDVRRRKIHCKR